MRISSKGVVPPLCQRKSQAMTNTIGLIPKCRGSMCGIWAKNAHPGSLAARPALFGRQPASQLGA
jgi:hypothetical protein